MHRLVPDRHPPQAILTERSHKLPHHPEDHSLETPPRQQSHCVGVAIFKVAERSGQSEMLAGPLAPSRLLHGRRFSPGPGIMGSSPCTERDVGRWRAIDTLLRPLAAGTVIARILAVAFLLARIAGITRSHAALSALIHAERNKRTEHS